MGVKKVFPVRRPSAPGGSIEEFMKPTKNSPRGIALLIVLWVLTILTVTAFSFAVMTRAEIHGLMAFKDGMETKFLAEAGINWGIMEIVYRLVNQTQTVTLVGKEVWRLDGTSYDIGVGSGGARVRVIDDGGKISLNGLTDASGIVLKNLLINQGVPPENADVIVDSILDWKDGDDLHRLNGAESDYYLSLPNPYKARDADFETLEELVLVRGMTPEILYGNGRTKGIIHFLTIYGNARQVNINAAPKEVLAALPGMDGEMVERLMAFRASAEIRTLEDVKDIIGDHYPLMAPYAAFVPGGGSAVFTVEATGYKDGRKRGHAILATVSFDSPQQYRYLYYKSPAEMIP